MRHTDIAIVGGGLAGSIVAAMLGRSGVDVVLIDPHPIYPADFRCEKLDSHAGRDPGEDGTCGRGAARGDARQGILGVALRPRR